jgi:hypothetical protein
VSCLTLDDWRGMCTQEALRVRDLPKPEASPRTFNTNYKLDTVLKEHLDDQKNSSSQEQI